MSKLTASDASRIAASGRPWSLRLEFVGSNPANQSGVSSKFWYATGRKNTEAVETGHGAIGSKPATNLVDWASFQVKVADKLAKGYDYVDAPFQRMSAANLAKLGGHTPSPAPAKRKPQAPRPAPASPTPSVPAPKAVVVAPQPNAPSASLLALPAPFCNVRFLKLKRVGTKVDGFSALDENQKYLLGMTDDSGLDFARDHDVEILWT